MAGIPEACTEQEFRDFFAQYGNVTSTKLSDQSKNGTRDLFSMHAAPMVPIDFSYVQECATTLQSIRHLGKAASKLQGPNSFRCVNAVWAFGPSALRGYGFVNFTTPEEAHQAIQATNNMQFGPCVLTVRLANSSKGSGKGLPPGGSMGMALGGFDGCPPSVAGN